MNFDTLREEKCNSSSKLKISRFSCNSGIKTTKEELPQVKKQVEDTVQRFFGFALGKD